MIKRMLCLGRNEKHPALMAMTGGITNLYLAFPVRNIINFTERTQDVILPPVAAAMGKTPIIIINIEIGKVLGIVIIHRELLWEYKVNFFQLFVWISYYKIIITMVNCPCQ